MGHCPQATSPRAGWAPTTRSGQAGPPGPIAPRVNEGRSAPGDHRRSRGSGPLSLVRTRRGPRTGSTWAVDHAAGSSGTRVSSSSGSRPRSGRRDLRTCALRGGSGIGGGATTRRYGRQNNGHWSTGLPEDRGGRERRPDRTRAGGRVSRRDRNREEAAVAPCTRPRNLDLAGADAHDRSSLVWLQLRDDLLRSNVHAVLRLGVRLDHRHQVLLRAARIEAALALHFLDQGTTSLRRWILGMIGW